MSVMLVPGLRRNPLSSSVTLASGVEMIISAFPALRAKGEHFKLTADHNLYMHAILPELPSEYANVGETSTVMLWNRHLGHINVQSVKKLAEEKGTGMVMKDIGLSVSNCDSCALAKS